MARQPGNRPGRGPAHFPVTPRRRRRFPRLFTPAAVAFGVLALRYTRGRRRQEADWFAGPQVDPFDLGTVDRLLILPLADADARPGLSAEQGLCYLIVADGLTILFDVGLSAGRRSALERNAKDLGVDLGAVDMIVISHAHPDHCGGVIAYLRRTFRLPDRVRTDVTVRTPTPLRHSTAHCEYDGKPTTLAPGIATTGPIARQLFLLGWTPEQALIVNVRGKGLVVIMGCGHQGFTRLISRVRTLSQEPIHAVVGGLHLPVHGLYAQDIIGSANWPWRRTSEDDVAEVIDSLRECHPGLVAISPHDSSAWTLGRLAEIFAGAYRSVRVGDEIVVDGIPSR